MPAPCSQPPIPLTPLPLPASAVHVEAKATNLPQLQAAVDKSSGRGRTLRSAPQTPRPRASRVSGHMRVSACASVCRAPSQHGSVLGASPCARMRRCLFPERGHCVQVQRGCVCHGWAAHVPTSACVGGGDLRPCQVYTLSGFPLTGHCPPTERCPLVSAGAGLCSECHHPCVWAAVLCGICQEMGCL